MQKAHLLRKLTTVEFHGAVMAESGGVVQLVFERYGAGRLSPDPESPK
jgi:hypothetical protein